MGFLKALLACLVALWLTGNIQPDSPIGYIINALGWMIVLGLLIAGLVIAVVQGPGVWRDFKSGKLRIR